MNIAIDGPSGAGKSTIAKLLAKELNITYLDTGAMYRALGLKAFNEKVPLNNEEEIEKLIKRTSIDIKPSENGSVVFLDGKNVSAEIRQHHISKMASDISAIKCVRIYMVNLQQRIAAIRDSVLDGRDIGTVVLPNADFKFYLTASAEVRAKRRYDELIARGEQCNLPQIKKDIIDRDYNDMHRQHSPLKKAKDAVEIDSSDLTIDEVKNKMLEIIRSKQ